MLFTGKEMSLQEFGVKSSTMQTTEFKKKHYLGHTEQSRFFSSNILLPSFFFAEITAGWQSAYRKSAAAALLIASVDILAVSSIENESLKTKTRPIYFGNKARKWEQCFLLQQETKGFQ